MTPEMIYVIVITIIAALLLMSERMRADLIALVVLIVLGITGLVTPLEAFSGFSSPAVIILLSVSIISEALQETGVIRNLGRFMLRIGGKKTSRMTLVISLIAAALSMFMNNIAAAGMLLPAVISMSRHTSTKPSRLLMPLSFAALLGGTATLLATANIITSSTLESAGEIPFGFLDFLPIGVPIIIIGALYMLFIGRHLLPDRDPTGLIERHQQRLKITSMYRLEENLVKLKVQPDSKLANRSLQEGAWAQDHNIHVVGLFRGGETILVPKRDDIIQSGDVIFAQAKPPPKTLRECGLRLQTDRLLPQEITNDTVTMVELVAAPHVGLSGKSLRDISFREKYGMNVLGVWREGNPILEDVANLPLQVGDALLVQGTATQIRRMKNERLFLLLEEDPEAVQTPHKAGLAMLITIITIAIAAFNIIPISMIMLMGAVLMLLTKCVKFDDAYRAINWKVIFLISGVWPLSIVVRTSGLSDFIVQAVYNAANGITPLGFAVLLIVLGLLLTQIIGGQVTALIITPIAIGASKLLGIDPRGLSMAAALSCSLAFIVPYGHPVNLIVLSSGGYKLKDFLRVGLPLTILVIATILIGLRIFWGI